MDYVSTQFLACSSRVTQQERGNNFFRNTYIVLVNPHNFLNGGISEIEGALLCVEVGEERSKAKDLWNPVGQKNWKELTLSHITINMYLFSPLTAPFFWDYSTVALFSAQRVTLKRYTNKTKLTSQLTN